MGKPKKNAAGFSSGKSPGAKAAQPTRPVDPSAQAGQALVLLQQGRLQEAEAAYRELINGGVANEITYGNLAAICGMTGRYEETIELLKKTLDINPNNPENLNNLGAVYKEQGNLTAAIASYNKVLLLKPNLPEVHNNLGIALQAQGQLDAAITSYTKALLFNSNFPEAHNNLGNALKDKDELDKAISSYNKALQLNSNFSEAHNNLGLALQAQGKLDAAIASFNKALGIKPNDPEIHHNLSLALLASGDYTQGWINYESRSRKARNPFTPHANPKSQPWEGEKLSSGEKLLLVSEQGLGDTLQFMRYAPYLKKQGVKVSICAQANLHSLVKASGIDESPVSAHEANEITEGRWIPLLSLPRHLNVTPSNPLVTEAYISTTDELKAKWKDILSHEKQPIIGLNWQGDQHREKTTSKGRSLPLESLAPLAACQNINLLSLQKGFGSEQLETCSFKDRFVRCQDEVSKAWDFLETAAIIANCDLIITSDTSVAHLAGGLGKTTWLLLSKVPNWRWGLEGNTSFWYPSMRLFRQTEQGNWDEVLQRVAHELQQKFSDNSPATPKHVSKSKPTLKPNKKQLSPESITAPLSLGELIDKITILEIKTQHIQGVSLTNVKKELEQLSATLDALNLDLDAQLVERLKDINADLWQIEDQIREKERQKDFGEVFIRLARSVYQQNDRRAAIKKEINTIYGSALSEEKSYKTY